MNSRERFLSACQCRPVSRPPVWFMRQAGRYLPEYRALRQRHEFLSMVRTPELAAEVSLQPLRRFGLDAAIVFSDILVVPEAMGQGYHFRDGGGIAMDFTLDSASHVRALEVASVRERLDYLARALRLVRRELGGGTALLGFAGAPWTLAVYMVEGGGAGRLAPAGSRLRAMADGTPGIFSELMEKLTAAVVECLLMQIESGADAVQIFDSWAALCGDATAYQRLSLQWVARIIAALPPRVPVIVFAKGMAAHAAALASTGARVLGVDWTQRLSAVRAIVGPGVALQGNLEPAILESTPEKVREATRAVLDDMAGAPGHIFNLGHGITPGASLENVSAMIESVHAFRPG
ncbi:MAG: uroporphyrinogen decarboxylase [Puniceicoccales bacterium]|jgi:uroporphyrinogen decarboxylase|nr:uroporphyrinogen decarboxylase [Puniceicoccales bacterium]